MKIFWSWQSDNHQPSGRYFVREILTQLAKELNGEAEDAERPESEDEADDRVKVDYDTFGVGGSPPIAETILGKIREAAVFVADVTSVGKTAGGKQLPNPNVMIELGYAMKVLSYQRIVLVMNTGEGASLKHLPFDLRHWRAPATYSLRRDATDERKAEVMAELKDALRERIIPSLKVAADAQREDRRRTHRAPELAVVIGGDDKAPLRISQTVHSLGVKTLDEIRAQTPLLPLPPLKESQVTLRLAAVPDLSSTLAALGYVKPISQWSREEIEGYNARVQHYYHEYEQFLDIRTEYLRLVLRSFELKLLLVNAGTLPATGIDVDVKFPKGIVLYEDKKFASEPEVPEPPPFEPFKRGAVIVSDARSPFDLSFLNQHQPKSTWVYPDERRVHFSINELKHNHEAAIELV